MIDVRRMQTLRAVVTSGSVTAAARNLGYTPSAVSQQIAALEKEVGIALLERVGRGVRPTEAGRLLTECAVVVGAHLARAETALAELRAGRGGRITIHYFASVGALLVAPALAALRREHPGVQVELRLSEPLDPLAEVRDGRADAALVVWPADRPVGDDLRLVHLLDVRYRAVLPPGHRLAAKPVLDLIDLADEPWVASESPGPCLDVLLDACGAAGFGPDFVVESRDYATAQGFAAAGLGIALVPESALDARPSATAVRELRNPEPVRRIHVAVRRSAPPQPAMDAFLAGLRAAAATTSAANPPTSPSRPVHPTR
ncbi:LysR family transcriptional regulator [Embleya hyalina]|uniref:LysR family transcriptional regulator n=1 Tax=Embleya hyalina TaxID=516124 RepID=A0A401YJ43_9ACTN|nr:LysR family transcriptional regulator [Embleya hyalina]GCD94588.1 LysR family transcriptional regulator [Embleya hyalina]